MNQNPFELADELEISVAENVKLNNMLTAELATVAKLQLENAAWQTANAQLYADNERLTQERDALGMECNALRSQVMRLRRKLHAAQELGEEMVR